MRNAVLAALTWAVKEKGVKEVIANVTVDNTGSTALIELLKGFEYVGEEEGAEWPDNKAGEFGKRRRVRRWQWRWAGEDW